MSAVPARTDPVRYVAIGDSFSEGVGDDGDVPFPGWAGRLAVGLADHLSGPVSYANLAIRGRLLAGVLDGQLDAALALDPAPTLITFCGGGNDMLRPGYDVDVLLGRLAEAADAVAARGIRLALLSPADPSARLPLGRMINARGDAWAEALTGFSRERGLPFVDVSRDAHLGRAEFWSEDRLHMNPLGHQRVADLALHAIADGPEAAVPRVPDATKTSVATELRYYRDHVVPWVQRRVMGRSSGDGRVAGQGDWAPVAPSRPGGPGRLT